MGFTKREKRHKKLINNHLCLFFCGEGGIRTPGTVTRTAV